MPRSLEEQTTVFPSATLAFDTLGGLRWWCPMRTNQHSLEAEVAWRFPWNTQVMLYTLLLRMRYGVEASTSGLLVYTSGQGVHTGGVFLRGLKAGFDWEG